MRYSDAEKKQLICVQKKATPDWWDSYWETKNLRESILRTDQNTFVARITKKYLTPQDGPILEGGCGQARAVYSLSLNGFDCIGVDYAKETIKNVKQAVPDLDVRVGDVRELPFPDDYFAGYWSLGVIEHFKDGYTQTAKEMARVIKPKRYLFLTFPFMSPLRKLKSQLHFYELYKKQDTSEFYQYVLNSKYVIKDFEDLGFKLISRKRLDGIKGTKDEIKLIKKIFEMLYEYNGVNFFIKAIRQILNRALSIFAGHSILLVFKKL